MYIRCSASHPMQLIISAFMHKSIPPVPSPPGLLRGICPPCQSRRWGICKFCTARGPSICCAIPELMTRTQFPIRILLHRRFYWKKSTLAHLSRTRINWRGLLTHVLDFMHAFLHCLSSQNYMAKLEILMWINVFGVLNRISVDIIQRKSFHICKTIHNI